MSRRHRGAPRRRNEAAHDCTSNPAWRLRGFDHRRGNRGADPQVTRVAKLLRQAQTGAYGRLAFVQIRQVSARQIKSLRLLPARELAFQNTDKFDLP